MSLRFTILGCGSSMGVPRVALGWGACSPTNPKNRRRRCSLLVEQGSGNAITRVLVDTTPDLRDQLLDYDINALDGVLITHEHADHTHGIDDLRPCYVRSHRQVDMWLDAPTSRILRRRFGYCFETPSGSQYPPILRERRLEPGKTVKIDGQGGPIEVLPVLQEHDDIASLGFRFGGPPGGLAYSADIKALPAASLSAMGALDVWVVDALRFSPHPSHMNLAESLDWIARVMPRRAILTNLHADFDYEVLRRQLPSHIEPAYDGMIVEFN